MPITLPQLSRREFLKRATLAGAAVAFAPPSRAGLFGKSRDKYTFAFFSDSHIAADAMTISRNVNMADHLADCGRELAAWPARPAAVIINGDLAFQNGLPGDYATFGKLIEPIRALAPVHLSLGNHDEREIFLERLSARCRKAEIRSAKADGRFLQHSRKLVSAGFAR